MSFDASLANAIGLSNPPATQSRMGKPDLTQADFLRLMTEQLKNQDPLNPLSNAEFVSQMAQMSTAQGVGDLRSALQGMADAFNNDQALRGAALLGRTALVETDRLVLAAGADGQPGAEGVTATPAAGLVTIDITTPSGALVRRLQLRAEGPGDLPFRWDGLSDRGEPLPPGSYRMRATFGEGRSAVALETAAMAPIESVTLDPQGLLLNLTGIGTAPLSSIRRLG